MNLVSEHLRTKTEDGGGFIWSVYTEVKRAAELSADDELDQVIRLRYRPVKLKHEEQVNWERMTKDCGPSCAAPPVMEFSLENHNQILH